MIEQSAKVIAQSISPDGTKITTMHFREWRPIHSELMTHKILGKSAGSSRARPSKAIIEQVRNEPMMPVRFGANQPGMQDKGSGHNQPCFFDLGSGNCPLPFQNAEGLWQYAAQQAAKAAEALDKAGYHKQIVNRLLEPFTYIDVLVTGTEWNNFFYLRDHEDADPTMRDLAIKAKRAMNEAVPTVLHPGEWHLPFIVPEDWDWAREYAESTFMFADGDSYEQTVAILRKISAARCARVSYKLFDGTTDHMKDLKLFQDLIMSQPVHASPSEHQATPMFSPELVGNSFVPELWEPGITHVDLAGQFWSAFLRGWVQFRKLIPNEHTPG